MIRKIDHIGIAVHNIDDALKLFSDALGLNLTHTDTEEGQQSIVAFLPAGQGEVELVEPMGENGPVARFLQKRGEGIHHICFRVTNIEEHLARLKQHGFRLLNEAPVPGAHGCRVAFLHPAAGNGVLIELSEKQ